MTALWNSEPLTAGFLAGEQTVAASKAMIPAKADANECDVSEPAATTSVPVKSPGQLALTDAQLGKGLSERLATLPRWREILWGNTAAAASSSLLAA